ncbi:MAG: hypothetical protein H7A55_09330 [Verrucomicrobiaceae bacterium]|nr:hypothetical protein [Verrucomicrobiaceae bacterium]
MPAGVSDPVLGGIAFGSIKLAGYCFAAYMNLLRYQRSPTHWFRIGVTRTLIGLAFGYPYFNWATSACQSLAFMLGLIPIRIIEWLLLIVLFYDRKLKNPPQALGVAVVGTIWSFALDLPATIGFFVVGGFWIC